MSTLIGSVEDLKGWARGKLSEADEDQLERLLNVAAEWVQDRTGTKWVQEAGITINVDGTDADGRHGEIIRIPATYRPVTAVTAVTEDGTALTVASGYSTSADVIVKNLSMWDRQCELIRRTSADLQLADALQTYARWRGGVQNIGITFTHGYGTSWPDRILQAVYHMAWIFHQDPGKIGKQSTGRGGHSATYSGKIPDHVEALLDKLTLR